MLYVGVVEERGHEPVQVTVLGEQLGLEPWVRVDETADHLADGAARDGDELLPAGRGAQRRRDADRAHDCVSSHVSKADRLGLSTGASPTPSPRPSGRASGGFGPVPANTVATSASLRS